MYSGIFTWITFTYVNNLKLHSTNSTFWHRVNSIIFPMKGRNLSWLLSNLLPQKLFFFLLSLSFLAAVFKLFFHSFWDWCVKYFLWYPNIICTSESHVFLYIEPKIINNNTGRVKQMSFLCSYILCQVYTLWIICFVHMEGSWFKNFHNIFLI